MLCLACVQCVCILFVGVVIFCFVLSVAALCTCNFVSYMFFYFFNYVCSASCWRKVKTNYSTVSASIRCHNIDFNSALLVFILYKVGDFHLHRFEFVSVFLTFHHLFFFE